MKLETKLKAILVTIAAFIVVALIVLAPVVAKAGSPEQDAAIANLEREIAMYRKLGVAGFADYFNPMTDERKKLVGEAHSFMLWGAGLCYGIAMETGQRDIAEEFKQIASPIFSAENSDHIFGQGLKTAKKYFFTGRYDDINEARGEICAIIL